MGLRRAPALAAPFERLPLPSAERGSGPSAVNALLFQVKGHTAAGNAVFTETRERYCVGNREG